MANHPAAKWLNEAGVDEIAGDKPRNFFEESKNLVSAKPSTAPKITQRVVESMAENKPKQAEQIYFQEGPSRYTSLAETVEEARKLADSASNLEDLRKSVEGFEGCLLKKTANKTVFADGDASSKILLIGEAPGADEDRMGIPFCGMSGQLLDKVLKSVDLTREKGFYITNTIFWRPPGNRKPTPEELAICKPFLEKHVALIDPKIILLVGATAVQAILEDNSSMGKLRGKGFKYKNRYMGKDAEVMVTYHPSYLMRSPLNKRLAWEDMLLFQERIAALN